MGDPFDLERARERRAELLREAEERRVVSALQRGRRGVERLASRRNVVRNDRQEAA